MVSSMDCDKVGKYLAELRKAKGLTQEQLSEIIGVSNKTISKWETGINVPDTYFLYALSKEFNVSVQDILNGEKIYNIMDSNNVIVKTITFYNTIFKRKISRISVLLIIMIAIVFSILFTVNNFNQNKVFELRLENSNDNNGYLVSNPKESIFFINKLHIKNEFEGTEREPLISSYGLSIIEKNSNTVLYNEENSFRQNYYLSQFIKSVNLSFTISKKELDDLNLKSFDNIYLKITYIDNNGKEIEVVNDINIIPHYSNTQAVY